MSFLLVIIGRRDRNLTSQSNFLKLIIFIFVEEDVLEILFREDFLLEILLDDLPHPNLQSNILTDILSNKSHSPSAILRQ